jgi:transcriptional regulator GlxA family with amidase domain
MLTWKKTNSTSRKIGVLLFDQFSNLCLANAIEPLRAANMLTRSDLYSWQFLTLDGETTQSSSGLQIAPHEKFGREGWGDILFVLPSYAYLDHATPETARGLRSSASRYQIMAGFDTGSWLMADAGLLDGRNATIHWEEIEAFKERFTEVTARRERFVIDGDRISSSGASAAFDLVLSLIGDQHGEALALEVATLFMQPDATGAEFVSQRRYSHSLSQILALMRNNLEEPLTISAIARATGQSQRNLEVQFNRELGAGPQQVYKKMRLGLAQKLVLETGLSVAEISVRSGYGNASAMTRAFRLEFGLSPSRWRKQRG